MKKIINGKVYDTETAKELASQAWNLDANLYEKRETLYRKKTGEYFLFGYGGPMTEYAQPSGASNWSGGTRIMPLTYAEALKWAEENLTGEEYEEIFGAVTEDDSRMQVCYSLSSAAVEAIRRRASEQGISASAYLDNIILNVKNGK